MISPSPTKDDSVRADVAKKRFRKVFLEMVHRRKLQQQKNSTLTNSSIEEQKLVDLEIDKRWFYIDPKLRGVTEVNNRVTGMDQQNEGEIKVHSNVFKSNTTLYKIYDKPLLLFWDSTSHFSKWINSPCTSQSFSLFMVMKTVSSQSKHIKRDLCVHQTKKNHIFSLTRATETSNTLNVAVNGFVFKGGTCEHQLDWHNDGQYVVVVSVNLDTTTNEHNIHFELITFDNNRFYTSNIKRFTSKYVINPIKFENSRISVGNNSFFVGELRYYLGNISPEYRNTIKSQVMQELLK